MYWSCKMFPKYMKYHIICLLFSWHVCLFVAKMVMRSITRSNSNANVCVVAVAHFGSLIHKNCIVQPRAINLCRTWWRHQMETFSALLALCMGNSQVPVNSPHKGQWFGALVFSLICAWINDWVNNREAGDLRRHRAHYDVNVMT